MSKLSKDGWKESSVSTLKRFDLTGRVALVTGGSRGLGREIALGLAEAGADVVIASRKLAACEEAAHDVEQSTGRRALPVACHVGNWDELDGLVDAAYSHFGKVDILINNAGMSPLHGAPETIGEDLFDKIIGVNLKGPFRLAALVGERMARGGGGAIVNISSTAAIEPRPEAIVYCAAKAGLNAITVACARAYAPRVRVNAIMAGPFLTDVSKAWDMPAFEAKVATWLALGRGGQPNEIVGAALYLASDAASFTTGAVLRVDGGGA